MTDEAETRAWLSLLRTPAVGPASIRQALQRVGSARGVLENPDPVCRELGLPAASRDWLRAPNEKLVDADLAWLARPGRRLLRCDEADFPPQLEHIDQPPAALFVVGDAGLLLRPQVAIVGSRSASAQGLADAREFARQFVQAGITVTSGMADGIDGAAHTSAMDSVGSGGSTIAALGTGADVVYPRKHRELAARIATYGALVSEFPPGTAARSEHFPRRNRIIAGLSLACVVIEAGLRSGSLITARLAAEQGREVFVVPGSIHNPLKHGCHRLIRDGARLVEEPSEVIEAIGEAARALGADLLVRLQDSEDPSAASEPALHAVDPDYARLLAALGHDAATLDELIERTTLKPAELSSMLLLLELDGQVASVPGGRYQRIGGRACSA